MNIFENPSFYTIKISLLFQWNIFFLFLDAKLYRDFHDIILCYIFIIVCYEKFN